MLVMAAAAQRSSEADGEGQLVAMPIESCAREMCCSRRWLEQCNSSVSEQRGQVCHGQSDSSRLTKRVRLGDSGGWRRARAVCSLADQAPATPAHWMQRRQTDVDIDAGRDNGVWPSAQCVAEASAAGARWSQSALLSHAHTHSACGTREATLSRLKNGGRKLSESDQETSISRSSIDIQHRPACLVLTVITVDKKRVSLQQSVW